MAGYSLGNPVAAASDIENGPRPFFSFLLQARRLCLSRGVFGLLTASLMRVMSRPMGLCESRAGLQQRPSTTTFQRIHAHRRGWPAPAARL